MKTFTALLTCCILGAGAAAAMVVPTNLPDDAITGESFTITFDYDSGSSCAHQQGVATSHDGLVLIFEVTTVIDLPPAGYCTGPHDMYLFDEGFVCNEPGLWTLRVIEHNVRPSAPDWPDEVEEFRFTVTGPVAGESISFGAIKALYR
ncbi:MAG: hypothetical protein GY838_10985 [bacterium]|nr:hypothetical protein [bacterium]